MPGARELLWPKWASADWARARDSCLGRVPGSLKPPTPWRLRLKIPLRPPPRSEGGCRGAGRSLSGPAGSQLRGQDQARLTVGSTGVEWPLAGGERLTVTRAMKPGRGAPGRAVGTAPSQSPINSPCPAGPGRRDQSHRGLAPPRGRPLKGQTPAQHGLQSPH